MSVIQPGDLMAKSLLLIVQGLTGRGVSVRTTHPKPGIGIETSSCGIALHYAGDGVNIYVNGDFIEFSDDPETVAGAAIAHLVHGG